MEARARARSGDALSLGLYGAERGREVAAYNPFGAVEDGGNLLGG